MAPCARHLHGVPIGVKDIMDTFDMPTGWGFEPYSGRTVDRDAGAVALCREAGAVILGKTVTSEFAAFHPRKTRNPHNTDHTPGVSSMGAAAGAADFMFPAGFGTQTGSSIIRPAACCGVIGYKPTFDEFPLDGIMVLGQTLDTLGFLARDLGDCALMRTAMLGELGEYFAPSQERSPTSCAHPNEVLAGRRVDRAHRDRERRLSAG